MTNNPDSRPSLYLNYITKPPLDADPELVDYLSNLREMLVAPKKTRSLLAQFSSLLTREYTGIRKPFKTTKQLARPIAEACVDYRLIHSLPPQTSSLTEDSLVVDTDEFAAYTAIVFEAQIRQRSDKELKEGINKRSAEPQVYWAEISDKARAGLGTHPLRDKIKSAEEVLNFKPPERDDGSVDTIYAPLYPWPPFLGSPQEEFANQRFIREAQAINKITPRILRQLARTQAHNFPEYLLDALRVGFDLNNATINKEFTITRPRVLPSSEKGVQIGAQTLYYVWQKYPYMDLTDVLNIAVRKLNIAFAKNISKEEY